MTYEKVANRQTFTEQYFTEQIAENYINLGSMPKGPKVGLSYAFRLNPHFGWKGKVKNLEDYRKKQEDKYFKEKRQEALKLDKDIEN